MKCVLIGGGGHAKVVIDVICELGLRDYIVGIIEHDVDQIGKTIHGVPILGTDDDLKRIYHEGVTHAFVAIGENKLRKKLSDYAGQIGFAFPSFIHPRAIVSKHVQIGAGSIVMPGAVVNSDVQIGNHIIVNTSSSVDHDCVLGNYTHISPGVNLCGGTIIHEGAHIGAGTVTIPNRVVGQWTVIGAGSTIVRNIPGHTLAYGVPCRPVKSILENT